MLHVLAVIVGMGAAIVSDVFFNIFIRDRKIQQRESQTLYILSKIIWAGLFFIVLTGLLIFLSDPARYNTAKFLAKMTIVGVIALNGILFWKIVHPALEKLDFHDQNFRHKYVRMRKISFALGSISVISWLSAFILGSVRNIPVSYPEAMGIYLGLCVFGIIASQALEYKVTH